MEGLEQFKQTFFQECDELLGDLETQLMALEDGSADAEALHAVFRAIHSIKGGAGAFGFNRLVSFAHAFETMLDLMRDGKVELTPELVSLSVRGGDVLADLVNAARSGEDPEPGFEDQLLSELNVAAGLDDAGSSADGAPADAASDDGDPDDFEFTPVMVNLDDDDDQAEAAEAEAESGTDDGDDEDGADQPAGRRYRIEFRPRSEMLRRANEPLLIVRQLKELGSLKVTADLSALPSFDELESDGAYLAWTFELETDLEPEEIDEVFEFVVDDCVLSIAPVDETAKEQGEAADQAEPAPAEAPAAVQETKSQPASAAEGAVKAATPATDDAVKAAGPAAAQAARKAPVDTAPAVTAIRVDLDRVDRLVNMVGEIVIAQAMVSQQIDEDLMEDHPHLTLGLEQLFQHTRNLQDSVMAIRAQPVRSVFARMPRLVRDLSAQTGKKIRLEMSGESTEIDKTVIEQLNDPLTHMIRNAADHGIESVDERKEAGKPAEGTIFLSAEQRGGRIVIEISDDGKGINREKVREKAIEKNLIAADANLSDEEIDNLVFLPGFSTADTVSNISGRGVGMDVVRQNIQKLGGRVSIRSQPGRGSAVILTLPLTLAVLEGMIVRVGTDSYIIPLTNIVESLSPKSEDVNGVPGSGEVLNIRGEYIKLIHLQKVFDIPVAADSANGLVILVEVEGGTRVGLVVDEIIGQQQVVIKSLEENSDPIAGIAGATILGDGRVSLILDVTAIRDIQRKRELGQVEPPATQAEIRECVA